MAGGKQSQKRGLSVQRFIGISLSGGKMDRACLSTLEYYPKQDKLFLAELVEKLASDGRQSADAKIIDKVSATRRLEIVGIDAPLKLPKCMRCRLPCPGYENCTEPEIEWMWTHALDTKKVSNKKNQRKLFTPYTQRCSEIFVNSELEEKFHLGHAMGANMAPLSARARFLARRIDAKTIEVSPRVSIWRIGRSIGLMKRYLRFHKHAVSGNESRTAILEGFTSRRIAFFYHQDQKIMVENNHAFESFIAALTGFLKFRKLCENRPPGYPRGEGWIEIPQKDLPWQS